MGENAKTLHSARWRMILYFLYSPFLTVARRIHRLVVCDRNHADPLTPISMSVRATRHVVAHWRWCTTTHGKMTIRSALPLVSGREREQHRLATRQFKHHQQPRAPGLRSWCTARRRDFVPCRALVDTLFEIVMHARWSWTSVDDKGNMLYPNPASSSGRNRQAASQEFNILRAETRDNHGLVPYDKLDRGW
jgi:hypothetical protein